MTIVPQRTSEQRARVLAEVQCEPDREKDQTATWSLMLLRTALRKADLPHISALHVVNDPKSEQLLPKRTSFCPGE